MLGIIVGGYHLLNEIGSGGFGTVYRAYDPLNRRAFALKRLNHTSADIERFRREGRVLAKIDHPNVITLLDSGDDWMALELMQFSLREVMASSGRLSISRSIDICRQVALGLQAVHEQKVIHRDINPNNVLFDMIGVVKISDFGLAREDQSTLTSSGVRGMGTRGYRSREQEMGETVDIRTDIYSLGATLYEMLIGWTPTSRAQTEFPINSYSQTLNHFRPDEVPTALRHIVDICLADYPEDRYQSMDDLLQEITDPALINRCALIDFYEATSGPDWKRNDNWLTDAPLSEWYGVATNHDGVVTQIELSGNNLQGAIPSEIAHLTDLEWLVLMDNRLSGSIPPEIGNLTELEELDLSDNLLSGSMPPEMGNLTKLAWLYL